MTGSYSFYSNLWWLTADFAAVTIQPPRCAVIRNYPAIIKLSEIL